MLRGSDLTTAFGQNGWMVLVMGGWGRAQRAPSFLVTQVIPFEPPRRAERFRSMALLSRVVRRDRKSVV